MLINDIIEAACASSTYLSEAFAVSRCHVVKWKLVAAATATTRIDEWSLLAVDAGWLTKLTSSVRFAESPGSRFTRHVEVRRFAPHGSIPNTS